MRAASWSSGGMDSGRLTLRDAVDIYKARFRRLWRVVRLSFTATVIAVVTVILFPVMLGIAVFSAHFFLAASVAFLALAVSAWLYWKSLRLAFGMDR
ncbi:hypothetical protein [Terracidiphilus gabretensis]|uniref:hypothetical protein n=1 Tax=Terracidiphilus gabretensis TaxID=1577687 RepID=UPI00071BC492|nr:hypothetical protein [Terracidiphilus gabretensis]